VFCPHIGPNERATDLAGWQAFAHRLSAIGNKVVDQGLQFGWHNHDFEFETCADGSIPMRVILETASEIDWEMDVAWTVRVHVKDIAAAGECGDEDGWADVGFGTMQWEKLVPTIVAKTKASLYIAEHDNPNDFDRFAKRSIASLQSYT